MDQENNIFHLLGRLEGKLDTALSQGTKNEKSLEEINKRVGALERWRAYLAGIAVACSTAAALIVKHI